jgi:hypothetical protein
MKFMNVMKNTSHILLILFIFVFVGVSCSQRSPGHGAAAKAVYSRSGSVQDMGEMLKEADSGPAASAEKTGENLTGDTAGTQRKLVRRANLEIRVQDLDAAEKSVNSIMEKNGAYASSTNASENSRYYTIRVPASSYNALLSEVNGMGRLLYKNESAEDVTLHYYDLEGRLATKRELLKTYQSYLGKAKNIEEILSVEEKIAGLEDEIDGTGRELRNLANQVDYSTVTLEISGPVTTPSYSAPTLTERFSSLFSSFGGFVSIVLVILLGVVIYGVPSLLILILLFWILFGKVGLLKKLWRAVAGKK